MINASKVKTMFRFKFLPTVEVVVVDVKLNVNKDCQVFAADKDVSRSLFLTWSIRLT